MSLVPLLQLFSIYFNGGVLKEKTNNFKNKQLSV